MEVRPGNYVYTKPYSAHISVLSDRRPFLVLFKTGGQVKLDSTSKNCEMLASNTRTHFCPILNRNTSQTQTPIKGSGRGDKITCRWLHLVVYCTHLVCESSSDQSCHHQTSRDSSKCRPPTNGDRGKSTRWLSLLFVVASTRSHFVEPVSHHKALVSVFWVHHSQAAKVGS